MGKSAWIAAILFLLPLSVHAQEIAKAELFTGYSLLRLEETNLHGYNASLGANINPNLAIVADFGGNFGSSNERVFGLSSGVDFEQFSFTAGPRIGDWIGDRVMVFAHALFGLSRLKIDANISGPFVTQSFSERDTSFAGFFGGGVDLKLSNSIALRLIQADYYVFRGSDDVGTGLKTEGGRFAFGLLFRFGRKSR